jgi:hypothetical protein
MADDFHQLALHNSGSYDWSMCPGSKFPPRLAALFNKALHTDGNSAALTLASSHAAILLALHKGFKAESNFKAFRNGESEFYDLYRRFLDSPVKFGATREEQIATYFEQAEQTRKYVRNAETDNFPSLEEAMAAMKKK